MENRFFAVQAPRGSAKAQPLDSLILTPGGWKTIGELSIGDIVFGRNGKEVNVEYLHPISEMDFYRIKLRDGREMECSLEHLFEVTCPSNTGDRVLIKSISEIQKNYKLDRFDKRYGKEHIEYRYFIDHISGIEFNEKKFIIDPYTLGLWLGDGHSAGQRITSADPEIFNYVPYRVSKNKAKYNYGLHGITKDLRSLNLLNNKHIPNEYFFGSIKQRESLLQGLIDTDGTIGKDKHDVSFCNINERLIDDVVNLVRSLGGTAWKGLSIQNFRGKKYPYFRVNMRFPKGIIPCRLKRKVNNFRDSVKTKSAIVDISYSRRGLGRCITVKDDLYVTNSYFKTHNSTVLAFVKISHAICFKRKRFIVIVQNTFKKAVGTLEGIKDEIRYNEKLKADFGITLEKDAEGDTIFRSKDGWRTRVLCKGVEQIGAVRGEKFGAYRPDYILGDDMEDDEMVKSAERRQALKELFDNALIPAGDIKCLDVDIVGTILHDDSLMAKLVSPTEYTEYRKLFFKSRFKNPISGKDESLWPERWTVDELNEMERLKPEAFAKEMQGDPSSGSLETIRREDFRLWRMEEGQVVLLDQDGGVVSRWNIRDCRAGIGIDMAWEDKKASDFTAVVPGLITPGNDLLVDTYINKRGMRPDEFESIIFNMSERYEALTGKRVCFGFEKAKLEKVMKWFLGEAMKRRGKYLWFKDISWGTQDKVERIMFRVANRYSQHSIYHKKGMGDLENQLIRLRSTAHDDLCLVGETIINTFRGNIKLEDVIVGDYVLTRNGFQKVINKIYSGEKEVISWGSLKGTPNHPVITTDGVKRLDSLHVCDMLYIWNERLLRIEERTTIDILSQKDVNTGFISGDTTNGKNLLSLYIDKYISTILEKSLKGMLFIIKMKTLLITNLLIWKHYLSPSICDSIQVSHIESRELKRLLVNHFIQKKVNKEQEIGIKVLKDISGTSNRQRNTLPKKRKVYNLTVENNNEYFANNILVHNCDAVSMLPEILAYAPTKEKDKPKADVFAYLQKQTSAWRGKNVRTSNYIFGQKHRESPIEASIGLVATSKGLGL